MEIVKNSIELGKNLKTLRKCHRFTQKDIANKLEVDRSTYTYYETGHITPPLFTLIKLAEIYNKDLTAIIYRM